MNERHTIPPPTHCDEDQWASVSDLMAGLMIIFLFIAITYIRPMQAESKNLRGIVTTFNEVQDALYEALMKEFHEDLPKWNAEIDKPTLAIRFKSPDILFETAQYTLRPEFKKILADFFPRYAVVLWKFNRNIEEIRIEGHTSSVWRGSESWDEAYFNNMKLSQDRTREVLAFSLKLPPLRDLKPWLIKKLTANGLSSSQVIIQNGSENETLSRRVEFRVRTNARQQIFRILETAK